MKRKKGQHCDATINEQRSITMEWIDQTKMKHIKAMAAKQMSKQNFENCYYDVVS